MQIERPVGTRLTRFNEILNILIRNDIWGLLRSMTSGRPDPDGVEPAPVRMRRTLEELGPTFIKIGQLLATRPDLVPKAYVDEFRKLYDETEPSPFAEVKQILEGELGRPIGSVFQEIAPKALASASIGQVHKAKLLDGTPVAVKVQHEGIAEAMVLDFRILEGIVRFIEKTFAATRVWQPLDHLEELRNMLERELDYGYERRNTQRVAGHFENDPNVHIPKVFEEYCSDRVLVMEFIDGFKFKDVKDPRLKDIDLRNVAKIVTQAMARQIFVHRLFHADPSPGNLMILASDKVAFLDFGAVGIVTERRSRTILRLITALAKGDVEATSESVIDLCEQRGEIDHKAFTLDVERILDFLEREEVSVADPRLLEMILGLAKAHRMLLPPDFVLITRALFQFEGFCRELDPDYELVQVLDPLAGEVLWKNLSSPKKQKELVEETVGEMLKFFRTFPHTLNHLVRKIERSELSTRIEISGLEGIKQAQGRGILKTGFTIIMASLIIGLAIVTASATAPRAAGQFLFGAGAIVVLWAIGLVIWSESFKGRRD